MLGAPIGRSNYKLNLDLSKDKKINHNNEKERLRISETAKFAWVKFYIAQDMALQSLRILYTFVLRAKIDLFDNYVMHLICGNLAFMSYELQSQLIIRHESQLV